MNLIQRYIAQRNKNKLADIESRIGHIREILNTKKLQWWTEEHYMNEILELNVKRDSLLRRLDNPPHQQRGV